MLSQTESFTDSVKEELLETCWSWTSLSQSKSFKNFFKFLIWALPNHSNGVYLYLDVFLRLYWYS